MKTITVIDIFGFFFRSYFALPSLKNNEGFPTGLLTGFVNFIDKLIKSHNTDYILFALDSKGDSFRREIYPEYKANRTEPPEDLVKQLPVAIEWIEKMGFVYLSKDGYEADDIIATVALKAKEKGLRVRIISNDKDLYQMIDGDRVIVYDFFKDKEIDERGCFEKFGVYPKDFVDFQAIVGDSSDNIPGVKGIGQKGASKLINRYHKLEAIYKDIENCGTPRIQRLLLESKEKAFLSRELVRMRTDIFDDFEWESFRFKSQNYLLYLMDEFERYNMRRIIKKIEPHHLRRRMVSFRPIIVDTKEKLFKILEVVNKDTLVAFDIETAGLDTKKDRIVGFSFALDLSKGYYVPISHSYLGMTEQVDIDDAIKGIKMILRGKVIGHNLKFDLSLLYYQHKIEKIIPFADTMIMAWLLNPSSKVGLDSLADRFFRYKMRSFKDIVKKGESIASVDIETAAFYAGEDAWMTYRLYLELKKRLNGNLYKIGHDVEYPFINVLISMEQTGIRIDRKKLEFLKETLTKSIESLTKDIYRLTDSEFNIKSTQQLGYILFEHLGLKAKKMTKSGYSTNEKVLKSLIGEHEVIPKIMEYRVVQKILSTYVNPLLKLANYDRESRIYTSFLQTGTSTGRLSSKNPNLQNIPVRSELGKMVRESFVAKEGYKLLSIDYSQIELRLLAHFSKDEALLNAFNSGFDIHRATAIKLFGEKNASSKRGFAKSINFGLLYGMGATKLSEELNISRQEANKIIYNYFDSFPTVKSFLTKIQNDVQDKGFVETILGRRRIFNYKNASSKQRASFMRESINTVFQGSASDLIKLSMLKISEYIENKKIDGAMLLQIHDELIFEIEENIIDKISVELKNIMENIMELEVPLVCTLSIGSSWKFVDIKEESGGGGRVSLYQ